jgi:TRAP-type mannitol/chloroaromatic compound transport system permease small subunit
VRVDILYDSWTPRTQALINLFGAIFFILPFVILVTYFSIKFSFDAYQMGEGSGDPGGLPYRWLIKGLIPFSFIMMGLVSLGIITSSILNLKHMPSDPKPKQSSLL